MSKRKKFSFAIGGPDDRQSDAWRIIVHGNDFYTIGKLVPVAHLSSIKRRKKRKINLGNVQIGGGAPVVAQSMTNTTMTMATQRNG